MRCWCGIVYLRTNAYVDLEMLLRPPPNFDLRLLKICEIIFEGITKANSTQNNALQPATPPLLPSGPLTEPYIPSSPVCRLPLLSDPPSLISDDIRAAENDIFVDDQLGRTISNEKSDTFLSNTIAQPQCVRPSDIFLPFMFSDINKPMHIQPRVKVEDLKVEVPLTPQNALLAESPSRYVKFSEHIEEIMLLDAYTPSPTFFDDAIMPNAIIEAAETVKRESEQEQLQEADAKSRVRVPKMDFKLPDAPWKYHQNTHNDFSATMDAKKEMLLDVKKNFGFPAPWPGAQTLNHILSWVPFPAELGILALEERYGDEHDLDSFLFDAAPVNNSSSLAWKPSGLRILNHGENDNDEEDLDFGLFMETQPLDVSFLIRKRKMQFDEERLSIARTLKAVKVKEAPLSNSMLSDHVSPESLPGTEPEYPHSRKEIEHDSLNQTSNFLIGGGSFSAGNALNNFLEIRASQKQKLIDSVYFDGRRLSGHNHGSNLSAEDGRSQNVEPTETIKTPESRPTAPIFDPIRGHRQCIISSALLKHRALIRTLQSLLPTLNLIERDFSAHNTTGWLGRGTISRSPIHSPLADEADLITSPSTAIIISTLANIRQKPLPGQKSKVTIQERIGKVSSRYENLFVLVSEGNTSAVESTDSLDDQSKAALGDFTSFCASIETYTLMYFVNGGEINLAKWIASVISQGPTMEASVIPPLLAEETLWELFLRRIGFNAFAAQVMLAELKEPHGLDFVGSPSNIGKFGLAAFVEMGFEERKVRFARLLGGTRVLDKIGGVLEKNWGV